MIAAEKDEQVSPALSKALFDASQSQQKMYLLIKNADHTSMFKNPEFIERYRKFLQTLPAATL